MEVPYRADEVYNVSIVTVPRLDIAVPSFGNITAGATPRFCPTQVTWSGGIFSRGVASISGVEVPIMAGGKPSYMYSLDFGGLWKLNVMNPETKATLGTYWYVLDNLDASHLQDRSYSLIDVTGQWEVLLTQKTYTGKVTVGDLLESLTGDAATASGVAVDKLIDSAVTMVEVQGGGGVTEADAQKYAISNSTYLAEINRVLGWFGYVIYADPYVNSPNDIVGSKISLISPLTQASAGELVTLTSKDPALLAANFTLDYGSIHSDVVVASNETNKGAVVGKTVIAETAYSCPDDTNYEVTKRFNPLFATVYRVSDSYLLSIANTILETDRMGAKTLKLTTATFITNPLWKAFYWEDKNGARSHWRVTGYEYSLAGAQCQTTLECMQVA